jgi:hypothetical protein
MRDHEQNQEIAVIGKQAALTAREHLLQAFRSRGITEETLAELGNDLLVATNVKVQWNGQKQTFEYSRPLIDNTTRFNAFRLFVEMFDAMPSKKVDIDDKRSVQRLAGMLFEKIDKMGMLGADDKDLPVDSTVGEMELMGEQVRARKMKKVTGEVKGRYVRLDEMVDGEEDE